jgi:hypothetical protein
MMGINEDKKSDFTKKMIDDLGLIDAIRYYGGLDEFKKHFDFNSITIEDKIEFFKKCVDEQLNKVIYFDNTLYGKPITVSKSNEHRMDVQSLFPDKVVFHLYKFKKPRGNGISGVEYIRWEYENVPDEFIDTIFIKMLEYNL